MSAYGTFSSVRQHVSLQSTIWSVQPRPSTVKPDPTHVTIHHLTLLTATPLQDLVAVLHEWFAGVVEEGTTYPQEAELGRDAFEAYFFSADVLVAVLGCDEDELLSEGSGDGQSVDIGIEQARYGRSWKECVAGFYYVRRPPDRE